MIAGASEVLSCAQRDDMQNNRVRAEQEWSSSLWRSAFGAESGKHVFAREVPEHYLR